MKRKKNNYLPNHGLKIPILAFIIFLFCLPFNIARAAEWVVPGETPSGIIVADPGNTATAKKGWLAELANDAKKAIWDKFVDFNWKTAGSMALNSAVRNALNTMAYDTATWLASGDKGQGPMFFTEGWEEYLFKIGDEAAGRFLEELGKNGSVKFNLCNVSNPLKLRIMLGLRQQVRPAKPACTFREMTNNWSKAVNEPNFLSNVQDMFNPVSNDLGIAFSLNTAFVQYQAEKKYSRDKDRTETGGWKDVYDLITGRRTSIPKVSEQEAKDQARKLTEHFGEWTGDALSDAAGVFISQFLQTMFANLLKNLAGGQTMPDTVIPDVYDYGSQDDSGGITAAKNRFRVLTEPRFDVRGDYNILMELASCPDKTKVGPTNCVITERFRQAIINRMTLGDAILGAAPYLIPSGKFGFLVDTQNDKYMDEGYPYRSMAILRKFRIVPVGWEIAAQYIVNNPGVGTCTLGDMVSCFDADSEEKFAGYKSGSCKTGNGWCRGLVDPNWVLKAPLNYCRREGFGPEILDKQTTGEGDESEVSVIRNDNYCADEQTCIKEQTDGSCEIYGYCTEERRTWNFNARNCADERNNTCQTFRSRKGSTVSYLKNTLDYYACSESNVGCRLYCADSGQGYQCNLGSSIYLDKEAETCSENSEGCHEFIRPKEGAGVNLISNGSFEYDFSLGGWSNLGTADIKEFVHGKQSIKLNSGPQVFNTISIGPNNYQLGGRALSLSFYAKGCTDGEFGFYDDNNQGISVSNLSSDEWNEYTLTHAFSPGYGFANGKPNQLKLGFKNYTTDCFIDAIKLEFGREATDYSDYRTNGLVYEKLLPSRLEGRCYLNPSSGDYRLKKVCAKDNAKTCQSGSDCASGDECTVLPECADFARKCNADEVDCELYTSATDGTSVPASVTDSNYCPAECKGYDIYVQKASVFDSKREEYFIPSSAKKVCSWESVGCDEFTNLDEIGKKGEARENYTALRQCINPDNPKSKCSEFYVWEGSNESGFQLKVFNLQVDDSSEPVSANRDDDNNDGASDEDVYDCDNDGIIESSECIYINDPAVTNDDRSVCNEYIYNLDIRDGLYNPNCRQFYNREGFISYHLYHSTISCSDNCHPYRRTEKNILYTEADCQIECAEYFGDNDQAENCACATSCENKAVDGKASCDLGDGQYVYCKNGGKWNFDHQACIYDAVPGEGRSCSSANVGCREYSGNRGSNYRNIIAEGFEEKDSEAWEGYYGSVIEYGSAESIRAGGHSLKIGLNAGKASAGRDIGFLVNSGSSYVLTFLAKTEAKDISAAITDGQATTTFIGGAVTGSDDANDWKLYRYNIEKTHTVSGEEKIIFSADKETYLDDIKVMEIIDHYYLIKNSWYTPPSCDNSLDEPNGRSDCFDNRCEPQAMLGCDQYSDRESKTHYLKSFNKLCQDSAVGCELLIDTNNSSYTGGVIYNASCSLSAACENDEGCDCERSGIKICVVKKGQKFCKTSLSINDPVKISALVSSNPTKDAVPVYPDRFIFAVYDNNYRCNEKDKGCQNLGKAHKYDNQVNFEKTYILNNPDNYDTALCTEDAENCEEWNSGNGLDYFKDPGQQVCEYKKKDQAADWWKKPVKKCDTDGNNTIGNEENEACLLDGDCDPIGITCSSNANCVDSNKKEIGVCLEGICRQRCILEDDTEPCPTTLFSTLGTGGTAVSQPIVGWAGLCPGSESSCTEYIDPISRPATNMVFNGEFNDIDGDTTQTGNEKYADGWDKSTPAGWYSQELTYLENHTLYLIQAISTVDSSFQAGIECPLEVYELSSDNNQLIKRDNQSGSDIVIGVGQTKAFYTDDPIGCKVRVSSAVPGNKVVVKKALISYQLKDKVNYKGCNGLVENNNQAQVDFDQGCILFNERSKSGSGLKELMYDADLTKDVEKNGVSPVPGPSNDSNEIIKVAPDRVCDKWLACRSQADITTDSKPERVCFDIGVCNSFDESQQCDSFVVESAINKVQEIDAGDQGVTASRYANITGYSKVGLAGVNKNTTESLYAAGYLPLGQMKQVGDIALVPNGSFEVFGANKYPVGWSTYTDAVWNSNLYSVINNPYASQLEGGISGKGGIKYPIDGKSILKYSAEQAAYGPVSELIEVEPNTDYVLGYQINTLHFNPKNGKDPVVAVVAVMSGNSSGAGLGNSITNYGLDWSQRVFEFNSKENKTIKLYLTSGYRPSAQDDVAEFCSPGGRCVGNIFIDNIKLMPALRVIPAKAPDPRNWNIVQSCRLYPQSDSLSCDYFNDSGIREKGWPGYCLEYDRSPGSPKNCILWWPVDKVKGDGIEEGAGYSAKFPVYYSLEGEGTPTYEYRHAYYLGGVKANRENPSCGCPVGYKQAITYTCDDDCMSPEGGGSCVGEEDDAPYIECLCYPDGNKSVALDGSSDNFQSISSVQKDSGSTGTCFAGSNPVSANDGWYPYDPAVTQSKAFTIDVNNKFGTCLCNTSSSNCTSGVSCELPNKLIRNALSANKIVQTVTPTGQNKYWSGRVFKGSSYKMPNYNYGYNTDAEPFGSMTPPIPVDNPYEWDGSGAAGIQPITFSISEGGDIVKAGQVLSCSGNCTNLVMDESEFFPYDYTSVVNVAEITIKPSAYVKRLFARAYGGWLWDKIQTRYKDIPDTDPSINDYTWDPSKHLCANGTRPDCSGDSCFACPGPTCDYCGIPPAVYNIKANGEKSDDVFIRGNGYVRFSFNTKLDSQQLPMTMISVDWGDLEQTVITGVEMRDRQVKEEPHSLHHLYDYWDMKRKSYQSANLIKCAVKDDRLPGTNIICEDSNCCASQVRVKIKDNWGWCTEGYNDATGNVPCPDPGASDKSKDGYVVYPYWIVVKENK